MHLAKSTRLPILNATFSDSLLHILLAPCILRQRGHVRRARGGDCQSSSQWYLPRSPFFANGPWGQSLGTRTDQGDTKCWEEEAKPLLETGLSTHVSDGRPLEQVQGLGQSLAELERGWLTSHLRRLPLLPLFSLAAKAENAVKSWDSRRSHANGPPDRYLLSIRYWLNNYYVWKRKQLSVQYAWQLLEAQ